MPVRPPLSCFQRLDGFVPAFSVVQLGNPGDEAAGRDAPATALLGHPKLSTRRDRLPPLGGEKKFGTSTSRWRALIATGSCPLAYAAPFVGFGAVCLEYRERAGEALAP
jgi:hypothetical protein